MGSSRLCPFHLTKVLVRPPWLLDKKKSSRMCADSTKAVIGTGLFRGACKSSKTTSAHAVTHQRRSNKSASESKATGHRNGSRGSETSRGGDCSTVAAPPWATPGFRTIAEMHKSLKREMFTRHFVWARHLETTKQFEYHPRSPLICTGKA